MVEQGSGKGGHLLIREGPLAQLRIADGEGKLDGVCPLGDIALDGDENMLETQVVEWGELRFDEGGGEVHERGGARYGEETDDRRMQI